MPAQRRTNNNFRMIGRYLEMMRYSRGRAEATTDQIAASLADLERVTSGKDFRNFKPAWALQFKKEIATRTSRRTGEKLSVATITARLQHLRGFFEWLSDQPGYRSRIKPSDASYFAPSLHDIRARVSLRRRPVPTVKQVRHLIFSNPSENEIDRRNTALIAFILLTGARADAAASFPLGNLDITGKAAYFDGRTSRTKNGKSYTADFFPVGEDIEAFVVEWDRYLREEKLFGASDPLFPATLTERSENRLIVANGIGREYWKSSEPVRRIFRNACEFAGIPYINPHSLRSTLGTMVQKVCNSIEEMKVSSQSLGHASVDTTFRHYGIVGPERQAEVMALLRNRQKASK